jgi:dihydroorotate dehydrogenase electron transfer subunit
MRSWQKTVEIEFNRAVGYRHFLLRFRQKEIASSALPGQFLMLKVSDSSVPLLRRPLGVHAVQGDRISVLYERVGEATRLLSEKRSGDSLDVVGPLGKGFSLFAAAARRPVLVAGGMGVAPLAFLAGKLAQKRKGQGVKPLVLIGACCSSHLLCERDFKKAGCEVAVATDNGSKGFHGYVTELLEKRLDKDAKADIYACGPRPMLKEVGRIAVERHIPCQLSLEEHMACGIGACLGCVTRTHEGYKRVCKDGPVFDAAEIVW